MVDKLIWSPEASEDLDDIYLYFSEANQSYAARVIDEIFEKVKILENFPQIGNMVKAANVSFVRETYVGNYKICYSFLNKQINILRIVHRGTSYGKL